MNVSKRLGIEFFLKNHQPIQSFVTIAGQIIKSMHSSDVNGYNDRLYICFRAIHIERKCISSIRK